MTTAQDGGKVVSIGRLYPHPLTEMSKGKSVQLQTRGAQRVPGS